MILTFFLTILVIFKSNNSTLHLMPLILLNVSLFLRIKIFTLWILLLLLPPRYPVIDHSPVSPSHQFLIFFGSFNLALFSFHITIIITVSLISSHFIYYTAYYCLIVSENKPRSSFHSCLVNFYRHSKSPHSSSLLFFHLISLNVNIVVTLNSFLRKLLLITRAGMFTPAVRPGAHPFQDCRADGYYRPLHHPVIIDHSILSVSSNTPSFDINNHPLHLLI